MRIFVGLGSNLGDREKNIRHALQKLDQNQISVIKVSSIYETEAVGPPQAEFLNAVCEATTALPPLQLLATLKSIEREMGRNTGERWGPREIDLDLLLYGERKIHEPGLVVPHTELTRRDFVLVPLLEIAPDLRLPSGEPLRSRLRSGPRPFSVRPYVSHDSGDAS